MDIYKIDIKLKQITPMLHFQGNETDATIRATELKPKLDRFILAWIAHEDNNITWNKEALDCENQMFKSCLKELVKTHENWFIDPKSEKIALNYKIRIIPKNPNSNMDVCVEVKKNSQDDSPMVKEYYGNAGYLLRKSNNIKSKFHKTITVLIKCFDPDLKDKIIELLPLFMDTTAFGFQQGKGYGNFRVNEINALKIKAACKENMVKVVNHFNSKNEKELLMYELDYKPKRLNNEKDSSDSGWFRALDAIAQYNHILKSGLNIKMGKNSVFIGSILLKKYFKEGNRSQLLNEKKAIKNYLKSNGIELKGNYRSKDDYQYTNDDDIKYMRGYFGFAQEYVFLDKFKTGKKGFHHVVLTTKYHNGEKKVEINRVPSPLNFHIEILNNGDNYNDYRIFVLVDLSIIKRLNKLNPDILFRYKKIKEGFKAKMAPFDMEDFFEYALTQRISFKERNRKINNKFYTEKSYELKRVEGVK